MAIRVTTAAVLWLVARGALAQSPRIDAVEPGQGPIAGGTVVRITGANFSGAAVTLDRAPITPVSRNDNEIRLAMPAHDNGYALLQVGTAAIEFLYVPPRLQDLPPGFITTVAGVGNYLRLELPATQSVVSAWGLAAAPNGDVFFVQTDRGLIFRVGADGILHHAAGTLGSTPFEFLGDGGPARDARIQFPRDVARDAAGNLYVNDSPRNRIRRIDGVTGIITTMAGNGSGGFSGDGGPATQAGMIEPTHLTCSPDGTVYFLDGNVRVRKVATDGTISTVAGNGTAGESGDGGPATAAQLNIGVDDIGQVAVDSDGNLYILETAGQRVRRVEARTGIITTFASKDARGLPFQSARGLAVDSAGNVYVATTVNIDKYDRSGVLTDSWGAGNGFSEDGTDAKQALLGHPQAMAVAANGDILFSDSSPQRIRRINLASGKLETVAGMGPATIGVPGPALGARFSSPSGDLAFLPSGDLVFADGEANWIYRIDLRSGLVSRFAGTGTFLGGDVEVAALAASVSAPTGLAADSLGNVYFADKRTIRVIDAGGIVHRAAGRPPAFVFGGDGGPALDADLCQPLDVKLDRAGNLFIADSNNNRIRKVDAASRRITTVAGSGPSNGFEGWGHGSSCGDGGQATSACLNSPVAVAVRDDGTVYINDFYNLPKIRKVAPDGTISSLAGWPLSLKLVVGPGQGIFGHGMNRIYRADSDRVRVLVGSFREGFGGDGGPASAAILASGQVELAEGLAIDAEGNLYFHDSGNKRIRAVRFGAVLAPAGATIEASAGTPQSVTVGSPLAVSLVAAVRDAGGFPAPGVRVDFRSPAAGPSCLFDGSPVRSVLTDSAGRAAAACTANLQDGKYLVSATPIGSAASVSFALTNTIRDLRPLPPRSRRPGPVAPRKTP